MLEQLPSVAAADCQIQIGHARMLEAVLALCHVDPNHRADLIHYVAELPKVPSSHRPPSPKASRGDRKKPDLDRPLMSLQQLGWELVRSGLIEKARLTAAAADTLGQLIRPGTDNEVRAAAIPGIGPAPS